MKVACRTSSPSTEARRTRSAGALAVRSSRTNSTVSEELTSRLAVDVSAHSVSK